MGFLHKLWDETLAGPAPETGLGKLRKFDSLSSPASPTMVCDEVPVTRSITILRTTSSTFGNLSPNSGSPSESPTTPGTPKSPGTPGAMTKKLTRRKSSADALERAEPRSPTGYDWLFCCLVCLKMIIGLNLRKYIYIFIWFRSCLTRLRTEQVNPQIKTRLRDCLSWMLKIFGILM